MSQRYSFEPKWLVVVSFFLAGGFLGALGLYLWIFNGGIIGAKKLHPAVATAYKYINPLLAVDAEGPQNFFEDKTIEQKVMKTIDQRVKNGLLTKGSVYFRDIEPGTFVGVNEDAKFSPGIFLKVPIMIGYYKLAETDPAVLEKMLKGPDGRMEKVDDLITSMIVNDDEKVAGVLFDAIDHNLLNDVYSDLGIPFKENKTEEDFISTKLYSLFFRVLYNATYLNREMSEKALNVLSQSNKDDGIAIGLPTDTVVAHKYHVRSFGSGGDKQVESHDCGIIYYPNHPYLLCVVGYAKTQDSIDDFFKEVTQMMYNAMVQKYGLNPSLH